MNRIRNVSVQLSDSELLVAASGVLRLDAPAKTCTADKPWRQRKS